MTVPTVAFSVVMSDVDGGDLGGFRDAADLEREVHAERFLDVQLHAVLRGLEALQLGFDQVRAGRHRGKRVDAGLVALLRPGRVGADVLRRHGGAGNARHPRCLSLHR